MNDKTKLLWINDFSNFKGGVETYIANTVTQLNERESHESILLYSIDNKPDSEFLSMFSFSAPYTSKLSEQIQALDPDIIYVQAVNDSKILDVVLSLHKRIKKFIYIHDHKYFCLREHKITTLSGNTCKKMTGLNCISCLGFIGRKSNKESVIPIRYNSLTELTKTQKKLSYFDGLLVGSEYLKQHIISHGLNPNNIHIIHQESQDDTSFNIDAKKYNKRPNFLYVGQLIKGKGVSLLIDAIKLIKDSGYDKGVHIDICGDGNERDNLEAMVKNKGLSKNFTFRGKLTQSELSIYQKQTNLVIIPSIAPETFNLVGIESMKYGNAVIVSDVGGVSEWSSWGINSMRFDSGNVAFLANVILYFIDDPKLAKDLGLRGYRDFQEKFKQGTQIKKFLKVIS